MRRLDSAQAFFGEAVGVLMLGRRMAFLGMAGWGLGGCSGPSLARGRLLGFLSREVVKSSKSLMRLEKFVDCISRI